MLAALTDIKPKSMPLAGLTLAVLALAVTACAGPPALERAVIGYDQTTAKLEQQLLLLNIARISAGEPIHFTKTSSIAATFDWSSSIGATGQTENPGIDKETLFWTLYKEVVKKGSDAYLPLFEKTGYKEGYLSGQTDPRSVFDKDAMIKQALEIAAVNPNVMIKVPGSAEGYEVIEFLTSKGISTNNTLTFVLPQLVDCAETVKRGLETARKNNVDLSKWRSVITHMESRYGDLGGLRDFAAEVGVELSDMDVRMAELAIFKKAYKYLEDNNLQSKMLSCSLRVGPEVDGVVRLPHLEEKTGASIVVTCPPTFIDQIINFPDQKKITFEADKIHEEIPAETMDKLMRIPYFEKAYAVDGYSREEYNTHPALQKTAEQFAKATEEMVAFAGRCLDNA